MNKVATAKEVLWNARKQIPNALVLYVVFFSLFIFRLTRKAEETN